jgi:uncharacterized membrane protein YdjX (TVP38/TMEM64 family)
MFEHSHPQVHLHKKKSRVNFLLFVFLIVFLWYSGRFVRIDHREILAAVSAFPLVWAGLIYVILYVVVSFFLFFSKDLFWFAGAVLFGPYLSAILVWAAEVINAFILFHLARRLGRSFVEHHLDEKYRHLDDKLGGLSFFWLFIFRAAPLIPYRFMDLGAGLTRIRFRDYLGAVLFASPLKIFWIQYILAGVGESIFNNPAMLVEYFLSNKQLLAFSLIYPLMVVLVIIKLESKK